MQSWFRFIRTCRCRQYRREPSTCRVAIVGAGWSGLAIAARLKALGVPFVGFEADDDVGGTWHPARRYPGLSLHAPAYSASFPDFPYPSGSAHDAAPGDRPSGAAMHTYIRRFAEDHGLLPHFSFSTRVTGASASSARSSTATLEVVRGAPDGQRGDAGVASREGPFDLVVYASLTAQPRTPSIPGSFGGHACHSSAVHDGLIARLVATEQRVVVVGAGRSGCDAVLALLAGGVRPARLTWLVRRPYYFWKLERMWHGNASGVGTLLRSAGAVLGVILAAGLPSVGWRLMWALDYVYSPQVPSGACGPDVPPDLASSAADGGCQSKRWGAPRKWWALPTFHMGLLDASQRRTLSTDVRQVQGEPARLEDGGLVLADGTWLPAEALIWATGYETGAASLDLSTDGSPPFRMQSNDRLFDHIISTRFPQLALPGHFFVSPGPEAAHEAAEYLVYHLCVRQPLEADLMEAEARTQMCRQSATRHMIFSEGFWQGMVLIHFDLLNAGILPMWVLVRRICLLWMFNRIPPQDLGLLPPHARVVIA